ncbi:MAG: tyrosine-type recombinase/integrase [Bryobacterales bacterium]|nr:tyrosine-type recombinase/integrase [Bryobacterales bacterium]
MRKLAQMGETPAPRQTIAAAVERFIQAKSDAKKGAETIRKYSRIVSYLEQFAETRAIKTIDGLTLPVLEDFHRWRANERWSRNKEIEIVRGFLAYCMKHKWIEDNPAKHVEVEAITRRDDDIVPLTTVELLAVMARCDTFGRHAYERRRARAMVLLMVSFGLRISDVVTLDRKHIVNGMLLRQATKNKENLRLVVPDEVTTALEALPHPRGAANDCTLYFKGEAESVRSAVKGAWRTLRAVFQRAGVERAHPHLFRHTFASRFLSEGGTVEDVAMILGDDPATIRRHYWKWIPEGQIRQDSILRKFHGTVLARTKEQALTC